MVLSVEALAASTGQVVRTLSISHWLGVHHGVRRFREKVSTSVAGWGHLPQVGATVGAWVLKACKLTYTIDCRGSAYVGTLGTFD